MYFVNERNFNVTGFKTLREAREYLNSLESSAFITKLDGGGLSFKEHNYLVKDLTPSLITYVSQLFQSSKDDAQALFYDVNVPFEVKHGLFFVKNKKDIVKTLFVKGGTADGYTDEKGNYYSCSGKKFHFS
jgi:hypothetical protein